MIWQVWMFILDGNQKNDILEKCIYHTYYTFSDSEKEESYYSNSPHAASLPPLQLCCVHRGRILSLSC